MLRYPTSSRVNDKGTDIYILCFDDYQLPQTNNTMFWQVQPIKRQRIQLDSVALPLDDIAMQTRIVDIYQRTNYGVKNLIYY